MLAKVARLSSLVAAALSALSIGCGRPAGPQAPVQPAAPTEKPPEAKAAPEAATDAPVQVLATRDDLVRVPRPRGAGWECHVEQAGAVRAGVRVSYVQCVKKTEQGTASMMAKDYEVPRAFVQSAETLSTVEYPKHYKKRWDGVKYTRSGPVDHHGVPAYEVVIELSRKTGLQVHMVERVIVVGTHTLNLAADAPPEMFATIEADMARWFDGADFAILRVDPKQMAALPPALDLAAR
jgi:hypothetical protein